MEQNKERFFKLFCAKSFRNIVTTITILISLISIYNKTEISIGSSFVILAILIICNYDLLAELEISASGLKFKLNQKIEEANRTIDIVKNHVLISTRALITLLGEIGYIPTLTPNANISVKEKYKIINQQKQLLTQLGFSDTEFQEMLDSSNLYKNSRMQLLMDIMAKLQVMIKHDDSLSSKLRPIYDNIMMDPYELKFSTPELVKNMIINAGIMSDEFDKMINDYAYYIDHKVL